MMRIDEAIKTAPRGRGSVGLLAICVCCAAFGQTIELVPVVLKFVPEALLTSTS